MKQMFRNPWVLLGLRLVIGVIFIDAGLMKIRAPEAFASSIATFRLLPSALAFLVALGLPWLETLCGVMLVAGWRLRSAAFSVSLLCSVFALAFSQALVRGINVDCGCFGAGEPAVWKGLAAIGRDLLLILGTLQIYIGKRIAPNSGPDSVSTHSPCY